MKKKRTQKITQPCDCAELEDWIALYIENEAPAAIRKEIVLHLQTCRACATLVRTLRRTIAYCQIETDWEVPANAHKRLWQRLNNLLTKED